jgi:hypothetical protein
MCDLPAVCAPANAQAIIVLRQAAQLATWVDNASLATALGARADAIETYLLSTFYSTDCQPSAKACFHDADRGPYRGSTTLPSTALALAAGVTLPNSTPLLSLLDFLSQRAFVNGTAHGLMGSPWLIGMLCQGLYKAAQQEHDASVVANAVDFAFTMLTANGTNSWTSMMTNYNATMTMEAWTIQAGAGTLSHPWNSAPAEIVPRFLAGVQPLTPGFGSFIVAPLPSVQLTEFNLTIAIPQGLVTVDYSYQRSPGVVNLIVSVPGNTHDVQLCVPTYPLQTSKVTMSLDGTVVESPKARGGGLLCVTVQVAGSYTLGVQPTEK